jgi:hypothetical protein
LLPINIMILPANREPLYRNTLRRLRDGVPPTGFPRRNERVLEFLLGAQLRSAETQKPFALQCSAVRRTQGGDYEAIREIC